MLGHVIIKIPACRVHGWVVSNNAAAEKLVRRLLLQATHVAIYLYIVNVS